MHHYDARHRPWGSRSAGSLAFEQGTWWLRNDSSSSVLYVSGDRGFRVDLPPGMQVPVQQWHAKIRLQGLLHSYTLRLRLPTSMTCPTRIGWQAHTVAKRCENIRDRYSRLGVPGLRGPRALEELATLLISTGELTADDLRRLPSQAAARQGPS